MSDFPSPKAVQAAVEAGTGGDLWRQRMLAAAYAVDVPRIEAATVARIKAAIRAMPFTALAYVAVDDVMAAIDREFGGGDA